jgi:hypothetical protein
MESSSSVRVTEKNAAPVAHAGIVAAQGNFAIARTALPLQKV